MKKFVLLIILPIFFINKSYTQIVDELPGFFISPQIGFDLKTFYNNNTPFIDYKGGLQAGLSIDYYWKHFGLGSDFNYINNKPHNIFPSENLYISNTQKADLLLLKANINRFFAGIGPSFRYQFGNVMTELNFRGGFGTIQGGKILLTQKNNNNLIINYHGGYKFSDFATKAQLRFSYFISPYIGIQIGTYFITHYNPIEHKDNNFYSIYYKTKNNNNKILIDKVYTRDFNIDKPISSIGIFASIFYYFSIDGGISGGSGIGNNSDRLYSKYTIVVHIKDKITKRPISSAEIYLKDINGNIVKKGISNKYGVVVFRGIKPDNYVINGSIYKINLENKSVSKNEFNTSKTIRKTIFYKNNDFILKGKLVDCQGNIAIKNTLVFIKQKNNNRLVELKVNDRGEFYYSIEPNKVYELYGKKKNYISKIKKIGKQDFKRKKIIFIRLKICMEKAGCGKLIRLKNIHYDLDKYFIRKDAKPELNRLVQFMKDNPKVYVEISSHTDSRASRKYNKILSENRAKAAVEYIVSKGIDKRRLRAVGYGEEKLLNKCSDGVKCTEAEHQLNRRTEMKVICPEKK